MPAKMDDIERASAGEANGGRAVLIPCREQLGTGRAVATAVGTGVGRVDAMEDEVGQRN